MGSETSDQTEMNYKKKTEQLDVKIETIKEDPDKMAPFVGYFPSGFDPLSVSETECQNSSATVKIFRNTQRPKRLQLVVSPNTSSQFNKQVDFVGTNYTGEAETAQVCTYALGVLDKEKRTLKIVPIASNKIFRLEPKVAASDKSEEEGKVETNDEQKDRLRELNNMYGTKKSISRDKKRLALMQKEDPRSQEVLDKKIEGVVVNREALDSAVGHNALNLPPHNASATTPQEAYPLDRIILRGEWDYLLDIFNLVEEGAEVLPDAYPMFVRNRIHKLKDIQDEVEKKVLACVLSYINHLIKFKDQHSMDGITSSKFHKIPSILHQKFISMFKDPDSKRLSDEKSNLLISYILVLTLFADEFRSSSADISKDLRMSRNGLRLHYHELGCKTTREDNLFFFTLPVPLEFPQLRKRRRPK